ncbi:glycosyltransferase family 4 protein [Fibrella sp. HMF5335]|uniref:Glycosyltransferase family 4 protein n=1 Tax=Fibrella rubiginis TaxID=2817060 RepID=A0A939GF49_9BACT|nr:glycosyltransferase family 1 protein [Fibrella rubiginis]MBO0937992.1 glycosyltransferase family 4 protein [Fibrella rubiginis]
MRIFVDTERIRDLNSGLGQTCLRVGQELVRQQPADADLTFLVPKGQMGVFGEPTGTLHYVEATWLRKLWNPGYYDVWHNLHQDAAYWPSQRPGKLVLTINDLNFLERPDYSDAKKARKLAAVQQRANRAQVITTLSDYTGSVVREHLTLRATTTLQTVYIGVSDLPTPPVEPPKGLEGLKTPFFLFLGVLHPKKNVHALLAIAQAFPDYTLVLAGRNDHPYAQHLREQAAQLGADNVLQTGPVDETTKAWLYANCEAFLFPSLSEGFGLPVVEAMSFGKPVFLSRLTSLPEIGGREAIYFDSFEPEDVVETLRAGMRDFYDDPLKSERLRWQANRFRWQNTGKAYWELYSRQ